MTDRQKFAARLVGTFAWRDTPGGAFGGLSAWWHAPEVLGGLGPARAVPHADRPRPTVEAGVEGRGLVLARSPRCTWASASPRCASAPAAPFDRAGGADADALLRASTPPGHQHGGVTPVTPRRFIGRGGRVLLAAEWVDTGAQATAARRTAVRAGVHRPGTAVVVDACDPRVRERLDVRGLLRETNRLPEPPP